MILLPFYVDDIIKNADLERKQLDFEFLRTAEEGD